MSEKKIKDLRINKGLTKQQLIESTAITEDELSFVTDDSVIDVPTPTEAGKVLTSTTNGAEWKDATGGGGGSLPDQTGNAGKFLTTDGTNASWGPALVNTSAGSFGLGIGALSGVDEQGAPWGGLALGYGATTYRGAMLLNSSGSLKDNKEVGTFKVCITDEVYTLIDTNGRVPSERLASDGTTGQVLTKTDAGMEWKTVSGGGDYLPLSGGTLTGPLTINIGETTEEYSDVTALTFIHKRPSGGTYTSSIMLTQIGFAFGGAYMSTLGDMLPASGDKSLGSDTALWAKIFVRKINNGADIDVPTTGGTMVVATPPTTAGNYVLKATVTEDGTVTTQWVAEA